jgi:hypothetical protein
MAGDDTVRDNGTLANVDELAVAGRAKECAQRVWDRRGQGRVGVASPGRRGGFQLVGDAVPHCIPTSNAKLALPYSEQSG